MLLKNIALKNITLKNIALKRMMTHMATITTWCIDTFDARCLMPHFSHYVSVIMFVHHFYRLCLSFMFIVHCV